MEGETDKTRPVKTESEKYRLMVAASFIKEELF